MWNTIAGNQLDDPVLDAAKAAPAKIRRHAFCNAVVAIGRGNPRASAKAAALGLHFPLPSPATRPQKKKPRVTPGPRIESSPRTLRTRSVATNQKPLRPVLFPSHLSVGHVAWVARRALRLHSGRAGWPVLLKGTGRT